MARTAAKPLLLTSTPLGVLWLDVTSVRAQGPLRGPGLRRTAGRRPSAAGLSTAPQLSATTGRGETAGNLVN